MNYKFKHIWILTAILTNVMKPTEPQFAMPMCAPPMFPPPAPPIFAMPAPMPMMPPALCPFQIPAELMQTKTSTTSTSTTTEISKQPETIAVAVPVPIPMAMPVPMAVPAFPPPSFCQGPPPRPKNCPPCPPCVCMPSCTPSFFSYCSPCHMKCRCKNREDTPERMPPHRPAQGHAYGMPVQIPSVIAPPPVVIVPYPPPIPILQQRRRPKKKIKQKYSSCSEDSTESSSSESGYSRKSRRAKRKRLGVYRRSLRSSESENELVKPMLSYIAENGDVKFKTRISSDDVAELLGEKEPLDNYHQTVQVMTGEDGNNRPNVIVLSKNSGKRKRERHKKVFLRGGVSNHVLGNGKKELIFKPPGDKKISNLSVSFQIS